MLSMKTKKPMKPMLEIVEITDDAGLSSPKRPDEQTKPSDPPRQRARGQDGHRVQRNDHAEAEEVVAGSVGHKGDGCKGVGSGRQRGLSCRVCGHVGRD
jgi:hypothetical protein